jgi:hypothetical protein
MLLILIKILRFKVPLVDDEDKISMKRYPQVYSKEIFLQKFFPFLKEFKWLLYISQETTEQLLNLQKQI